MAGPGSYCIGEEELVEITEVLKSGHLFRYGNLEDPNFRKKVFTLEENFAKTIGVNHCIATVSGTLALLNALTTAGIKEGDEVIAPGYTYVATFSAIIKAGGIPVLAEINDSLNLDPTDLVNRITDKTKFIIPVHMLGNPCDLDPILHFAKEHQLTVIEDCCQAAGATYKGKRVGSFGAFGAFSLNFFKTITAGDGGLLVTNNQELYENAFAYHDQGHIPLRAETVFGNRNIIGLNLRMNELTGAVGLAQLRKLDSITEKLRTNKAILKKRIGDLPPGVRWRKLNDQTGECGTLMTAIFDSPEAACRMKEKLNTTTVSDSGWHVYSNMEHINHFLNSHGQANGIGALPKTDDLLSRAINFSVGVVDEGLGAGYGINIFSDDSEIEKIATEIQIALNEI